MDVINQTLQFLKSKVDNYNNSNNSIVEIMNIATLNDGDEYTESTSPIILSIVNIEQDTTSRNPNVFLPLNNGAESLKKYKSPAQNLLVSLLFTAYSREQKTDKYQDGIVKLEHVIRCLQEQNVFYIDGTSEVDPESNNYIKLILEMESLNLSQLNQLWSMLGNKYMPSVLFKMKMITIQHDEVDGGGFIERANIKLWNEDKNDLAGQKEETNDIILNK